MLHLSNLPYILLYKRLPTTINFFFVPIALLFLSLIGCTHVKNEFNGSIEELDIHGKPKGWNLFPNTEKSKYYYLSLDSTQVYQGKYSLAISTKAHYDQPTGGVVTYVIPGGFPGKEIELRGYIKTENVSNGFAGLWLRIDKSEEVVAFDNMSKLALEGTSEWKEYSIKLPYDEKATSILLGGLLAGNGKMWLDNLRLYVDGKPIQDIIVKPSKLSKAETDTTFSDRSRIDTVKLSKQSIKNLTTLGHIWGFLKYYHPAVGRGEYNMDAELFRVMPFVIKAANNTELCYTLEQWVDRFGKPKHCNDCNDETGSEIFLKPDHSFIFNTNELSQSLIKKLKYIQANRNVGPSYYVEISQVGNSLFKHEKAYKMMEYPDAGFRLLSLYRYWNIIHYFFPNKHLIGNDWNEILPKFIPLFVSSTNKTDYALTTLTLISSIHDTHANIWSFNPALEAYKGINGLPFQARFIENKLTVTDYYSDTLDVKRKIKIGDVITSIDGVDVKNLITKFLPIASASNYSTQLRDLPLNYLLRTNKKSIAFKVVKGKTVQKVTMNTLERNKLNFSIDYDPDPNAPGYQVIDGNIGYLFPGKFKNRDLLMIEKSFAGTKGIIVDMRCYPSEFMVYSFVPYIKSGREDFANYTMGSTRQPGLFTLRKSEAIMGLNGYKNKVVVIVNEQTQSQAEYTTVAFQSSPNVTVIGSTTAGADGDVSKIVLPGNIHTMISGIGILYPDGTETQRKGVKIDYKISPTIAGIKIGKDELLEKAKEIINKN